jgi:CRP-like cAMP-binding protein
MLKTYELDEHIISPSDTEIDIYVVIGGQVELTASSQTEILTNND